MTRISRGLIRLWAVASVAWVGIVLYVGRAAFDTSTAWSLTMILPPLVALALITAARWTGRGFTGR
jgi:hypothetical protein